MDEVPKDFRFIATLIEISRFGDYFEKLMTLTIMFVTAAGRNYIIYISRKTARYRIVGRIIFCFWDSKSCNH